MHRSILTGADRPKSTRWGNRLAAALGDPVHPERSRGARSWLRLHPILTLTLTLLSGCSLYAPEVPDCSLSCSETSACPASMRCADTFCRPKSAVGVCECRALASRPCGSAQGQCVRGIQTCSARGEWSACVGEVGPTPEVCDGLDNDCDGLVDKGPLVPLTEGLVGRWGLFGFDGGVGLVYGRGDGGLPREAVVVRYDTGLKQVGSPTVVPLGSPEFSWAASGPVVWLGWGVDGGVAVVEAQEHGELTALGAVVDADFAEGFRLGASRQVVGTWLTRAHHARLATWDRQGKLGVNTDMDKLDSGIQADVDGGYHLGPPMVVEVSNRGGFAFYKTRQLDQAGDYHYNGEYEVAVDVDALSVTSTHASLFGEIQQVIEVPGTRWVEALEIDALPGSYISLVTDVLRGIDALMGLEFNVGPTWEGMDLLARASGEVHIVVADRPNRRIVLERVVGHGESAIVSRFPLSPADGYGVPRVAQADGDEMLHLAMAAGGRISARRVCGISW